MRVAEKKAIPGNWWRARIGKSSGDVFAGIFICSHNPDVMEQARVWNVRIGK